MSIGPYTSGTNFSAYLPKVSVGDSVSYSDINLLSKAITRNALTSGVGVNVRRTSAGTAIVASEAVNFHIPFVVTVSQNSNGDVVLMMSLSQANIWAGSGNVTNPASQDFDYQETGESSLNLPIGDFDYGTEFATMSKVQTEDFPRYVYWKSMGGGRIIWFELDEDMLKPSLRYTDLEVYARYARKAHAIPIAYVDNFYNVLQINAGVIWADPLNLRRKNRHPWQVRLQKETGTSTTRNAKIEQGSVISYPPAFVDIMADSDEGYNVEYPFAIKRGESLGGGWHVNDGESWGVEEGDFIYLKFERDVGSRTYDALGSDDTQWKCTINKHKSDDIPKSYYDGNYNTQAYKTCGDGLIPNCGTVWTKTTISKDPVPFIPNTWLYLSMQNKHVQLVSDGLIVYPIAKIVKDSFGELDVVQFIRSDFYFQPPLDAHFGLETIVNDLPPHHSDFTVLNPNP